MTATTGDIASIGCQESMNLAECGICFDPLANAQTVGCMSRGRRVCGHFFHEGCCHVVRSAPGGKSCPICRATFEDFARVPDVQCEPRRWFDFVDLDGNGSLSQAEILHVLKATLKLDHDSLEQNLPLLFSQWDPNGDGRLEFDEMMGPHGLFYYVRDVFRASGMTTACPSIQQDRKAWFRFWDSDGSGSLSPEEVVRSLVKTFNWSPSPEKVQSLREIVNVLWYDFDDDNSGEIDMEEFCRSGVGLADVILANLNA
jgi:Ca2+-binding EF-hand superfamily protein